MGDTHCLATKCSWRVGEGVSGWSRSRAAYLALVRRLLALLGDLWSAAPESQGSRGSRGAGTGVQGWAQGLM